MIPLSKKTEQDFLSVKYMDLLRKEGVEPIDAKYTIIKHLKSDDYYVVYGTHDTWKDGCPTPDIFEEVTQTYTISEILYKLPEWLTKDGYKGLQFFKDAPFYCFSYENDNKELEGDSECVMEYPIESAALMLIWCVRHGHPYVLDVSKK